MFSTQSDSEHISESSRISSSGSAQNTQTDFRRGKCKWFNTSKGWGFITPDDGSQDVFVHQSVLEMAGFRSLAEEEIVDFKSKKTDKGDEATIVTGPNGINLTGSQMQAVTKKRFRKTRCYNCGQFANHLAAKCTVEAQPKKCHHCKSPDHLMADCVHRKNRAATSTTSPTDHTENT